MPRSFEEKYEVTANGFGALLSNRLNDTKGELKVQLPCKVVAVDYANNFVDVEILDYDHDESGRLINYPILPNIPIRQPQDSGLAYIRLPIQVGDIGTIEFFDSSVQDLITTGNYDFDYTEEWHSINYGLFTNGFLPKGKLFNYDYNSKIVIGTKSGKFIFKVTGADELEIEAVDIKIKSETQVFVDAPSGVIVNSPDLSVSGDVTVGTGASGVVACQGNILTITNGIVTEIV